MASSALALPNTRRGPSGVAGEGFLASIPLHSRDSGVFASERDSDRGRQNACGASWFACQTADDGFFYLDGRTRRREAVRHAESVFYEAKKTIWHEVRIAGRICLRGWRQLTTRWTAAKLDISKLAGLGAPRLRAN